MSVSCEGGYLREKGGGQGRNLATNVLVAVCGRVRSLGAYRWQHSIDDTASKLQNAGFVLIRRVVKDDYLSRRADLP